MAITLFYERPNTSGTVLELPVIVDVDGDFHADTVFATNTYGSITRCEDNWPNFAAEVGAKNGVHIARDIENRWVSTHPVWNQHAYSVTNVCDGIDASLCPGRVNKAGAIPIGARNNWELNHLNNFRQNVQGAGLFNAPDFQMTHATLACNPTSVDIEVTIANRGTLGVLAGVNVALFATIDASERYVTTLQTTRDLPPGASETLSYPWQNPAIPPRLDITIRAVADSDVLGAQAHHECNEDNNEVTASASCRCLSDDACQADEVCVNIGVCMPRDG